MLGSRRRPIEISGGTDSGADCAGSDPAAAAAAATAGSCSSHGSGPRCAAASCPTRAVRAPSASLAAAERHCPDLRGGGSVNGAGLPSLLLTSLDDDAG
jgi:hypothetical protein